MISFEEAIESFDVALKKQFVDAYLTHLEHEEHRADTYPPKIFTTPSYSGHCRIVDPKMLPARRHLDTVEGLATLIHSITHIEYSAIDLALDAVYRFKNMPKAYKVDWMVVAQDEIRHFYMLQAILEELGYHYGDFDVHSGLFDVANHTREDILDRMAIVPRYYEASGLDVNPQIIKKLQNQKSNPVVAKVIDALEIIYQEEIDHVAKGDRWFKAIAQERGLEAELAYMQILDKYELVGKHRPHINVAARKAAGFSCEEIVNLGAKNCQ